MNENKDLTPSKFTKAVSPSIDGIRHRLESYGFLKFVHDWMDRYAKRYADLQTEQLKKEVEFLKRINSHHVDYVKQLQSQLSEKDKELSELKAKHKEDVKKGYEQGRINGINSVISNKDEYISSEQYYTQTHGQ